MSEATDTASNVITLADFAQDPVWVGVRMEARGAKGKATKVPLQADGRLAAVNKKEQWSTLDAIKRLASKDGVGIILTDLPDGSYLCGVDYDACRKRDGSMEHWAVSYIALLNTYCEYSPNAGVKAYFRVPGMAFKDFHETLGKWYAVWPQIASEDNPATDDHKPQIEVHAGHRFFLVTGDHVPGTPEEVRVLFPEELKTFLDALGPLPSDKPKTNGTGNGHAEPNDAGVISLLLEQASEGKNWHESMLRAIAMMVAQNFSDDAILLHAAHVTRPGYTIEQTRSEIAVMLKGARDKGWTDTARKPPEREFPAEILPRPPGADDSEPPINARREGVRMNFIAGSETSDESIAQYVAYGAKANLSQVLAYQGDNDRWLVWNTVTKQWRTDGMKAAEVQWQVKLCIHDYVAQYGAEWKKPQINSALSTQRTVQVTKQLSWLLEAKTRKKRDAIYYLQTPSATWDLRKGTPIPMDMRKEMYDTRYTAVDPAGPGQSLATPLFDKLLLGLANGDPEVAEWVWHYLGYCLLGDPRGDCFLLVHGTSGNGKTRLNMVLEYILGGYYVSLATECLMERGMGKHTTELNRLRGKRVAVISEVRVKDKWNEALLKQITGNDRISARNMREDASDFRNEAGLLVMVNDPPNFTHVTRALLRRFRMIGTQQVPDEIDEDLAEKIQIHEAPAVLARLMQYAMKVYQPGPTEFGHVKLPPTPAAMNAVARDFMSENDPFYAWIIDACDFGVSAKEEREALLVLKKRYEDWAKKSGTGLAALGGEAITMREFRNRLQSLGIATTDEKGRAIQVPGAFVGRPYVEGAKGIRLKVREAA